MAPAPRRALTAKFVENVVSASRKEVPDGGCRGLYLLVTPTHKGWCVRYTFSGRSRKLTLEGFPTLAEARRAAATALADVARGVDPASERKRVSDKSRDAFAVIADQFLDLHGRNIRENTLDQYRHVLGIATEAWRDRPVQQIKRRDVVDILDQIAVDRPVLANRTHAVLSKLFAWSLGRDVIDVNPVTGVPKPAEENARNRVLSDDEIKRVWTACNHIDSRVGALAKLLALTGQRRTEVSGMCWNEISGDLWSIPAERVKNKRPHVVPLSRQVLAIIEAQPRIGEGVFTQSRRGVFGGLLAREKIKLDELMKPDAPWVFHDLRRTCVTHLSEMGFDRDLVELIVNHVSGSRGGVAGTYNRSERMADRRAALQRWADHIDQIVTGETAAVLPFGRRS